MKAIGIVESISGNIATVISKRSSACSSCHNCTAKGACHAELVFGSQTEDVSVKAYNKISAKSGDVVELESSSSKSLLVLFITFVLPVILTIPFYLIFRSSNLLPILLIAVFVAFFIITALIFNCIIKNKITSSVVRIIEESKDNVEGE